MSWGCRVGSTSRGSGLQLRIYVRGNDQWHGAPLYAAIVQEARKHGLAGATAARGIMGYGAHSTIHAPHLLHATGELPVVVEIVDAAAKIRAFLPVLDAMVREGTVTLADVEIVAYGQGR